MALRRVVASRRSGPGVYRAASWRYWLTRRPTSTGVTTAGSTVPGSAAATLGALTGAAASTAAAAASLGTLAGAATGALDHPAAATSSL